MPQTTPESLDLPGFQAFKFWTAFGFNGFADKTSSSANTTIFRIKKPANKQGG
jgi:hypothetical protein